MNKQRLFGALCAAVLTVLTLPTHAALIGALPVTPGGTDWQAYYDDVANLSWTADANINGTMTWDNANAWADSLDVGGVTGWRLPSSLDSNGAGPCGLGFNCTDSEMGNLYYNVLGNSASGPLANTGPFTNIQPNFYWSSTGCSPNTACAWGFNFGVGAQGSDQKTNNHYAWAVRTGDVGAVPVPAAVWLFGSGLLGLVGIARRKKAA